MPHRESNNDRAVLRSWLKNALKFGAIDKLPPEYADSGETTEAHARRLLAALIDPESASCSIVETLARARAFRLWVEDRRRWNRRHLLAQRPEEDEARPDLEFPLHAHPRPAPPRFAREDDDAPGWHPLWDRELDG